MKPIEQTFPEIEQINNSFKTIQSQFSELQTLKTSLLTLKSSFQIRAKELETNTQALKSFEKFLSNRDKDLKLREERLNSIQKSLDDRQKELHLRENQLNMAKKEKVCSRCKRVGFKVSDSAVNNDDDSNTNRGDVKFLIRMDGRILQMFLNDRFNEHGNIGQEVYYALKLSNDPGKLVLDAMQGFFPSHLRKDDVEYEESVVMSTCVLLLEQLMKLEPEINKAVREEANELGSEWRRRITDKGVSYMVVLGFLLLVVAFDLGSQFDLNELRRFCDVIHQKHLLAAQIRKKVEFIDYKLKYLPKYVENSSQAKQEQPCTPDSNEYKNASKNKRSNDINYDNEIYYHRTSHYRKDSPNFSIPPFLETGNAPMHSDSFSFGVGDKRCRDAGIGEDSTVHKKVFNSLAKKELPSNYGNNNNCHPHGTCIPPFSEVRKAQSHSTSPLFGLGNKWYFTEKETENARTVHIANAVNSPFDVRSLCKKMDAIGLKSYLVEHVKELDSVNEKVFDSLRRASDPAKLVLNVVREFYQESNDIQGDTFRSCCIFLLEVLMKLSPKIKDAVEEESKIFASLWKARLAKGGNKPLYVWVFLKLLAAYKLVSSFEANELLSLFSTFYNGDDIYEHKNNPELCRALGLEAKIPDHIQCLIQENRRLEAVRFICAFNLTGKFPPVPLLKEHLEHITVTALQGCKDFDNSIKAQNEC